MSEEMHAQIVRAWEVLFQPDQIVELRAPKAGRNKTISGYFDNADALIKAVLPWDGKVNLYVTLNPINPALLARSTNKAKSYAETTTADKDIIRLRWLLIDFDAVRPAGISATDAEHQAALQQAATCRAFVAAEYGVNTIAADSGNGAHLLIPIDLHNTPENVSLLKTVLHGLGTMFDTDAVQIDRATFNPARICKLAGTLAVKGDNTADRPYRRSCLMDIPADMTPALMDVLQCIAAFAPQPEEPAPAPSGHNKPAFDVRAFLTEHGITYTEGAYHGGVRLRLAPCPFNPDHGGDAAIFLASNGAIGFRCFHNGCSGKRWADLRALLEPGYQKGEGKASKRAAAHDEEVSDSQSKALVAIGRQAKLFFDTEDAKAFARFEINGHIECWPLRSRPFRDWLYRRFYEDRDRVPGAQAVEDALRVLDGDCRFGGVQRSLALRVTKDAEGMLWIDLADADWRAVRVTEDGWEIVANPPPLFRRHSLSAPQCLPVSGGGLELLRGFLNVKHENAWYLLIAWLVAAMLPGIAHPVLVVHGEQGSAKSTLIRLLGLLIDPTRTPLRSEPRDIAEWIQAAAHSWAIMLDNVTHLPNWLSDAICRAVTGDGFSKRQLYTDDEDIIFTFRRVIGLNGIEVVAQRADLLDRSILMPLEPISPEMRRTEGEVLEEFEQVRPAILGALLDTLAGVLAMLPTISLPAKPRMADFAKIGVAVEQVLDWPEGAFMTAYGANIADQHVEAISGSMVGEAVCNFMDKREEWDGTVALLHTELTKQITEARAKQQEWPKSPRGLSGQLHRIAPNLRGVGIYVKFGGHTRKGTPVRIEKRSLQEQGVEQSSPPLPPSPQSQNAVTVEAPEVTVNPHNGRQSSHSTPATQSHGDGGDDSDDEPPPYSDEDRAIHNKELFEAVAAGAGAVPDGPVRIGGREITDFAGYVRQLQRNYENAQAGGVYAKDIPKLQRELDAAFNALDWWIWQVDGDPFSDEIDTSDRLGR